MKTRLIRLISKSYLFMMVTFIVSSFSFMSCSNDVENIIVLPGWPNGGNEYVKKDGSNFIMNIGDSNYGTQSMMTRAYVAPLTRSVTLDSITASKETGLTDVIVGTGIGAPWYSYKHDTTDKFDWSKIVGASEGYVYSRAYIQSPYDNEWDSKKSIDDKGELTISAIKDTVKKDYKETFYKPVPVAFWGRHDLAVNDSKQENYVEGTTDNGWSIGSVTNNTLTAAISKNIQYANSGINIKLQLGKPRFLAWYDGIQESGVAKPGVLLTENNIDNYPTGNDKKDTLSATYDRYVQNANLRKVGNYYHEHFGNTIAIKQKDGKSWHFIGPNDYDDINFEITEIRVESSSSCTYGKDYTYTPSNDSVKYSYDFESDHVKSGDSTALTIMPTLATSSKVILHCKITKFPPEAKRFTWYINKSLDDNTLVAVNDNVEFYIIGKISNIAGKRPSGSPYEHTYKSGIYCPDVITTVNIMIDDLCVDGAAVTDPDAPAPDKNIIWNYDWKYGSMDGQWSIGSK